MVSKSIFTIFCLLLTLSCKVQDEKEKKAIRIYSQNPFYWEYNGNPILLVGGSNEDNMFNHPEGLEQGGVFLKNEEDSVKSLVTSGAGTVKQ